MKVSYIIRSPDQHVFSIERVFASIIPVISRKVQTEEIKMPCFGTKPTALLKNLLTARKCRGDIIHITGDVHYTALVTPKKKTIITIHDMVTLENCQGIKRAILRLFWYTLPLRRCKSIVAISEKTKTDILTIFPRLEEKVTVIPDPIDGAFEFMEHVFNADCPKILQIGTKENKNLFRVVDAIERICCKLEIVGKLSEQQVEYLKQKKIDYSNCFHISDQEMLEKYRQCDIVIFASTYEGFGMPIVEAQTTGRPVVTSCIEPMASVAGAGACLVDPYDVLDIQKAIQRIISDVEYREAIVDAGKVNARKYTPEVVGQMYYNLYSQLK